MSSNSNNTDILALIKHNFGRPSVMTWGWPLMIMAIGTGIIYALRCLFKDPEFLFPATSLAGCSVFMILGTLIALVFPAVFCGRDMADRPVGHYTGIGTLILAFFSGIPLMMIRVPLYNIMSWTTLRFSGSSVLPVFFHSAPGSAYGTVLAILSDIIIPSFGASLFFFGLMFMRFKSTDRLKAYVVITIFFVLYSLDYTSILATAAAGIWCCYLRSRVHNMWAPFLCLLSMKLAEMYLPDSLSKIDIFTVQTHSDVGSTFFYSSLPSFFMGLVLLLFFIRVLDSFAISVRHEITGSEDDEYIPPFDKSINLSLLLTLAVFITIWILMFKGVHL